MCSTPSPTRSRTRGHRTAAEPMPVPISRSGRCPWRTSRRRPSSVNLSVWVLSQAATSASTACPNSVLAPLRKTSVSGSENVPGWVSSKTLVSVTAYHSFGGEVEALNTPTIRRLTPSCRHQLSALALYWRDEDRYPSNLTDVEWERLKPLIPEAGPGGRPRKTDMRAAMNAIFYLLRTDCPWRYLPRDEFPPRSTVYNIFRKFQKDGVWEAIWEELHVTLREQLGREASPTAAVIDSQTLKAAEKGAVLMAR